MLRRLICGVIAIVLMIIVLSPSASGAEKIVTITGRVYLPAGEVAPAGGMRVQVLNGLGDWTAILIAQGQNSASYSLSTKAGLQQSIYYLINTSDYAGTEYIRQAYYAGSISRVKSYEARVITPSEDGLNGIDLYVLRGVTISGTITLPEGYTAPLGGTQVQVGIADGGAWVNVVIPAGRSSVDYVLTTVAGIHKLSFISFTDPRFLRQIYYHHSGSVDLKNSATWVDASGGHAAGKNVELIPGVKLIGTVTLKGMVAPLGGQHVVLETQYGHSILITVPAGQSTLGFTWTLPQDLGPCQISYQANGLGQAYYARGYYNADGMLEPTEFELKDKEITGIDIVIGSRPSVSGTVVLPENMTASPEGLKVLIDLWGSKTHEVTIPAGKNIVTYNITVEPGRGAIAYKLEESPKSLLETGYYSDKGVVEEKSMASTVTAKVGDNVSIDLALPAVTTISGVISLPEGDVAPEEGLAVAIFADRVAPCELTIPAGANSLPYSMQVLVGQQHIYYHVAQESIYWFAGYYTNAGMSPAQAQCDIASDASLGIDLLLIQKYTVHGMVSLPDGAKDSSEIAEVEIMALGVATGAQIQQGELSTEYAIDVPAGASKMEFRSLINGIEYLGSVVLDAVGERAIEVEQVQLRAKLALTTVIGKRGYILNGETFDYAPVTYNANNDTYMPLRMLEALGAIVDWDEDTKTAVLTYGDNVVTVSIGVGIAFVNGHPVALVGASGKPAPVVLSLGRTMVPTRFVSESLGFEVKWEAPATLIISAL